MKRFCFQRKKKGVSFVEVLTVISIIGILASIGVSGISSFKTRNDFLLSVEQIHNTLRMARMKAIHGSNDDDWSASITANQILIFKGNNSATRDVSYDQTVSLSGVESVSGLTSVNFSKKSGLPSNAGTIYISDGNENKIIEINEKGMVLK